MKALVWKGGQSLDYEDVAEPEPADHEHVFEIEVAGICGSDLHGYRGHPGPRVPPLVLGHEAVGRVAGTRYVLYPLVGCRTCERCAAGEEHLCNSWRLVGMHRPGVFAQRVSVPESTLVPVPESLDVRRSVLAEPLACCISALRPLEIGPGTHLLVVGCGPIGLLTIHVGMRSGAQVTALDPVAARRALAGRLGASSFELEPGTADVAVDAAGFAETWRTSIDGVRNGGHVVVVGLGQAEGPIQMATVVRRALTVRGQFAYSRADFAKAVEILAEEDLDICWLDDAPLEKGAGAFAKLAERPDLYSKILLWP